MGLVKFQKGLAYKQAQYTIAIAFGLGVILSGIQIYLDYFNVQRELNNTMAQVLKIMSTPVSQAVSDKNKKLTEDLIVGLFQYEPIQEVHIYDENKKLFLSVPHEAKISRFRWLSDWIFGQNEVFNVPLLAAPASLIFVGTGELIKVGILNVVVDTSFHGFSFLKRAGTILMTGILRNLFLAGILFFFFHHYLTKPFLKLEKDLERIVPDDPEKRRLICPKGHEHDELGILVANTNQLLQRIGEDIEERIKKATEAERLKTEIQEGQKREAIFQQYQKQLQAANGELQRKKEQLEKSNHHLQETLGALTKTQDQLIVQEKLASLGTLTAGIAHEIRNPLNFVVNYSKLGTDRIAQLKDQLIPLKMKMTEEVWQEMETSLEHFQKITTSIYNNGERANNIVTTMMAHAQKTDPIPQLTDLHALIDEHYRLAFQGFRMQFSSFHITLETKYAPSIEKIEVFPQDLGRVFLNLFSNTFYATREKSQQAVNEYSPKIEIQTERLENQVRIRIKDNGTGIPQEVLPEIFNPFFTTKPPGKGTGLGLSLNYEIVVKEHHGTIEVNSKAGEYTEFVILLPLFAKGAG